MTRIITVGLVLLVLGVAGAVQAQIIDCSGGCTETKYGLGAGANDFDVLNFREDQVPFQFNSSQFTGSVQPIVSDPNTAIAPACRPERLVWPLYGQIILREQDSCVMDSVADGDGCMVEIPDDLTSAPADRSGVVTNTVVEADLGGVLFQLRTAGFSNLEGSVGERVLIGGGPATKIVWDDKGPTDPQPIIYRVDEGLTCCTSSNQVFCGLFNFAEYPILASVLGGVDVRRGTPDWIFTGGAGTDWEMDPNHQVPGQEQGLCRIANVQCDTISRPCLGVGDSCDLRSRGLTATQIDVIPDGHHNPTLCNRAPYALRGFVNRNCWLKEFYDNPIDPLQGCLLGGFGNNPRPDLDCDGVDDVAPDLCPLHSERNPLLDTNEDGIGDECQCGDTNTMFDQNGELEFVDALRIVQTVQGTGSADFRLADTDGNKLLSFGDAFNVVQGVQLVKDPTTFTCGRNP